MGTRGAIARPTAAGGFEGRYHHWDSYPTGLGRSLFDVRKRFFGGDTEAMLKYLIDDHPAGWSSICGADLTVEPGFNEQVGGFGASCIECGKDGNAHLCQTFGPDKHAEIGLPYPCGATYADHLRHHHVPDAAAVAAERARPNCYCHGDRAEKEWLVTRESASGSGVEYAYVIEGSEMKILASFTDIGSETGEQTEKMIGFFGMGDDKAGWAAIAIVDLDGPEPDWEAIKDEPLGAVLS